MVTLPKKRIKVLVVDDSLMMRQVLSDILAGDPEIQVVGTAHDGKSALERVKALKPDVLTLDVEMPTMDGIECLRRLMKDNPTPVVMVSSITYQGGFKTMQALEAGAFDFIQKPKAQASSSLNAIADQIRQKLKTAVSSGYLAKKLRRPDPVEAARQVNGASFDRLPPKLAALKSGQELVIAVGISTGGPPCVSKIFETLSKESPPVLVVQHMPEGFTKAMAERIDKVSSMRVKEAENGDLVKPGMGFIAPGHSHMLLVREAGELKIRLAKGDTVSGHRPSVDVLFGSVLEACGPRAVGVIMTGMGRDGVSRLKDLRSAGAHTIAQDEASCVVFGMPRIAIQEDAVDEVLSLDGIAVRLQRIAKRG